MTLNFDNTEEELPFDSDLKSEDIFDFEYEKEPLYQPKDLSKFGQRCTLNGQSLSSLKKKRRTENKKQN